jgi:Skp family chaperone for outer membrane proteins
MSSASSKIEKYTFEFKRKLKEMSDELNTNVYDKLSVIIEEWAKNNSINLVMGKMEVIFNTDDIDATEQILEVIKEKGVLHELSNIAKVDQKDIVIKK